MSTQHLRNISISQYESFLELAKCKFIKIKGGHFHYFRADLGRPIIFQTHIDPVPEFIIRNGLRPLGISKKAFFEILEGKKEVVQRGKVFKVTKVKSKK